MEMSPAACSIRLTRLVPLRSAILGCEAGGETEEEERRRKVQGSCVCRG